MSQPLQSLVAEFEAADIVMRELIEGVGGITRSGLSDDAVSELKDALAKLKRRQSLLSTAIEVLHALHSDGYPTVMPPDLSNDSIKEIEAKVKAMDNAAKKMAEKIIGILKFGKPEFK